MNQSNQSTGLPMWLKILAFFQCTWLIWKSKSRSQILFENQKKPDKT